MVRGVQTAEKKYTQDTNPKEVRTKSK